MKWILLFCIPALLSCTTHPHSEGRDQYINAIEKASAGDKQFAGLYHNFEFRATILNRNINRKIHDRLDKYYAWDEETSAEKWQEREETMRETSQIWLSFFTANNKDDNLANKKTIWKIYLIAGGTRYEGRAKKSNMNQSEAKALMPYHSRWTTGYYVDFPVPTSQIENQSLKLIITGPLGRREVTFSQTL